MPKLGLKFIGARHEPASDNRGCDPGNLRAIWPDTARYLDLIARGERPGSIAPISPAEILRTALLPQVKTKPQFAAARR